MSAIPSRTIHTPDPDSVVQQRARSYLRGLLRLQCHWLTRRW